MGFRAQLVVLSLGITVDWTEDVEFSNSKIAPFRRGVTLSKGHYHDLTSHVRFDVMAQDVKIR